MNDEMSALLESLDTQREHVLGALDGLSDEDLRRPVLPSGWTPLGLVHHLAIDVERLWYRNAMAGDPVPDDDGDDAWQVPGTMTAAEVLALYRDEIARANAILETLPADAMPKWWPDFFPDFPPRPLRKVMLHVIAETATHAGHLDAARELTDGSQWIVLTE
jgi:uncharacterized damage-inducible protein DinB